MPLTPVERISGVNWYHTIDLGHFGLTRGVYDHRFYIPFYGFPEDMSDQTVLDIGAGDGFFSFLFEEKGAAVTALNPPSWDAEDFLPKYQGAWQEENHSRHTEEPLSLAKEILGSQINCIYSGLYDLSPEKHGSHDIVFCGSVLCHLMNPLLALIRIYSVTKSMAIIATIVEDRPGLRETESMTFIGANQVHTFWAPTVKCLMQLCQAAGFTTVEHISTFSLEGQDNRSEGGIHAVIHAYR